MVAGIPDSGRGRAIGYANEAGIPYRRPFVKHTPTWPGSFVPQDEAVRDIVTKMKLIPIRELIQGKRLLFCEDPIVRGTQLKDTIQRLYDHGAGSAPATSLSSLGACLQIPQFLKVKLRTRPCRTKRSQVQNTV